MKMSIDFKDIDRGFNDLIEINRNMPKGVSVGIFGSENSDVVKYASKNEFGVGVPERPFMRHTFDIEKEKISDMITKTVSGYIKKDRNLFKSFGLIGNYIKSRIQNSITTAYQWAKPNAPLTKKLKKSDKPLIDTGRMRASITYKVNK